ncbi:MAG: hemerythrin domain-containing protein [Nitriliruptoraceae bacterium]
MTIAPGTYQDHTREELYELAQEREIQGRAEMTKEQLIEALELSDVGPDAVDLILRQHEEVRGRFAVFDQLSGRASKRKDDLVASIVTDLVKHAEMEEQLFYPAVREEIDGLDAEIDEDLEEHHAMELLLDELDGASSAMLPRFDAKVEVLKEIVLHHMEEEETDLLPKVRAELDERHRRELGGAMLQAWRIAPTRPHPRSPDTPPGNVIAGVPAAATDAAVETARGATAAAGDAVGQATGAVADVAADASRSVRSSRWTPRSLIALPFRAAADLVSGVLRRVLR